MHVVESSLDVEAADSAGDTFNQNDIVLDSCGVLGPSCAICRLPPVFSRDSFSFHLCVRDIDSSAVLCPQGGFNRLSLFTFVFSGGGASEPQTPNRVVCFVEKNAAPREGIDSPFPLLRVCVYDFDSASELCSSDAEIVSGGQGLRLCISRDETVWTVSNTE